MNIYHAAVIYTQEIRISVNNHIILDPILFYNDVYYGELS